MSVDPAPSTAMTWPATNRANELQDRKIAGGEINRDVERAPVGNDFVNRGPPTDTALRTSQTSNEISGP